LIFIGDMKELKATVPLNIRFSEVDSMNIVWHGSYVMYFEDAREAFGKKYGIAYLDIFGQGYYAPLVELSFKYKNPITYDMKPEITITYKPVDAAKIVFDYEITNPENGEVLATGHSVQVFMDLNYQLVWVNPEFYEEWKKKWIE